MGTKPRYDEEVRRRISIMEAYLAGASIEITGLAHAPDKWFPISATQFDNWTDYDYRVKLKLNLNPDTIDWKAIHPKYRYLARDSNGDVFLYEYEPDLNTPGYDWSVSDGHYVDARLFTSYQEGEVSWDKSLVTRP